MQKKLWLALVEHKVFPGTRAKLLYQEKEPTNAAILAHFTELTEGEKPSQGLTVTSLLNLSSELNSLGNREVLIAALKELDPALVSMAAPEKAEPTFRVRISCSNKESFEQSIKACSEQLAMELVLQQWVTESNVTISCLRSDSGCLTAQAYAAPGKAFYGGCDAVSITVRITN